jgi:hypothetical protein
MIKIAICDNEYQTAVEIYTTATKIDRVNKIVHAVDSRTGEEKSYEYTKLILDQGGHYQSDFQIHENRYRPYGDRDTGKRRQQKREK